MRFLFFLSLFVFLSPVLGRASDWQLTVYKFPTIPKDLWIANKRSGLRGIRIRGEDGRVHRFTQCGEKLCHKEVAGVRSSRRSPDDAVPNAVISSKKTGGIVRAWPSEPTRRYGNGVFGEKVDAGAITIVDKSGKTHRLILGMDSVFEDLNARLVDLDKDGKSEIVIVRSYLDRGSALVVLKFEDDGLKISAETQPLGASNFWLNPAGIADFDGDGVKEIAVVVRPHEKGILEFWEYRYGLLKLEKRLKGFSNHLKGSAKQNMSVSGDFDGDGITDLMIPDFTRRVLRVVSIASGRVAEPLSLELPGKVVTNMVVARKRGSSAPAIVMGLDNRSVAVITRAANPKLQ